MFGYFKNLIKSIVCSTVAYVFDVDIQDKKEQLPFKYNQVQDRERFDLLVEIRDLVYQYYLPFDDEFYSKPENENCLNYRCEELRSLVANELDMCPMWMYETRNYNTKNLFEYHIGKLSEDNLKLVLEMLKEKAPKMN